MKKGKKECGHCGQDGREALVGNGKGEPYQNILHEKNYFK